MDEKNKNGELIKKSSLEMLKGKTITRIDGLETGSYDVIFYCSDGTRYQMYPEDDSFLYGNDCYTAIEEISGDIDVLIGHEILIAEERQNDGCEGWSRFEGPDFPCRWTFYTLATVKGYVDIRWYGHHNGYYSDEVCFFEIDENNNIK